MTRLMLAFAILIAVLVPSGAQQKLNTPGMTMPVKPTPGMGMEDVVSKTPYHPGLGELMTAFVQPRHIKLGLAGMAQNWDYAAYELGELRETFEDVGKLILKHGKLDIPQAIAATMAQPIDAVDAAIKARDAAAFATAYADLTAGCNACHQSADHPMIVIKVPTVTGTAFPDQDFSPAK